MKTTILASIVISSSILFSQTTEVEDFFISSAGDYYSLNYLNGASNGRGNTGIGAIQDIMGVMVNPAGLNLKSNNQAGIQYTYKTTQKWDRTSAMIDNSFEESHLFPAAYVAYGRKLSKNLTAAFVYCSPSSRKVFFDDDFYYEYAIHSFNIPVSYNFGKFSLGMTLNFSYYRNFIHGVTTIWDPINLQDAVSTLTRFNVQGGLLYSPVELFSAGITFTPGFKGYPESDIEEISSSFKLVSKFPTKIGAGIRYSPLKNQLNLYLDYNFVQTSDLEGYKDRHDFNLGGDLVVNKQLTLRAGVFTFFDNRDLDQEGVYFPQAERELEQIFLTIGATAGFKNIEITGSIMDSHISSGFVKVTHINLGTAINF
jgi:long-subunit fatty acid transport protein